MNSLQKIWGWIQIGSCPKDKQRTLFKGIINDHRFLALAAKYAYLHYNTRKINATMTQDDNDPSMDLIRNWFKRDDDDDDNDTQDIPLPENCCKKCRSQMRELNTGLPRRIYACPKCDP